MNPRAYKIMSGGTGNMQLPKSAGLVGGGTQLTGGGVMQDIAVVCPGVKVGEPVSVHAPATGPGANTVIGGAVVTSLGNIAFRVLNTGSGADIAANYLTAPTAAAPWRVVVQPSS